MPTLSVELNGDAVHAIRAPDRFTAAGPFAIAFENRGRSTHVHLNVDDELDRVASLRETNHYIDDGATRRVHVPVGEAEEAVRGKLKVVTGYGSNTRYVDVRIEPPTEPADEGVAVDETLSEPPERPPAVPPAQRLINAVDRLVERGGVPAAVLAFVAVVVGVAVALAVGETVVSVAVGLVLTVSLAAALLSVW